MAIEDAQNQVLGYLKKKGQSNTFRLARELGIERNIIFSIIKKLEEKKAIELKHGNARFLKFPSVKIPAKTEVKKAPSAPKIKVKSRELSAQKAKLHEKIRLLGSLQYENKELKEKLSELEGSIKRRLYTKSRKFREQAEHIEKLEKRMGVLKQKAKVPPKVITKKIVVPKVITKTIVKRVIKKVPVEVIKKVYVKVKESEAKQKKFILPKFNLPGIKNIQEFKKPEFLGQKLTTKVNFSDLNKNIQQIHVPEMLKKG